MKDCNSEFTSTCRSTERAKAKIKGNLSNSKDSKDSKDKVMVTVMEVIMGKRDKHVSSKKEKSVKVIT